MRTIEKLNAKSFYSYFVDSLPSVSFFMIAVDPSTCGDAPRPTA